jgi:hypothetical protein
MSFSSTFDKSSSNGVNGFKFTSSSSYFGVSVTGSGDINAMVDLIF